YQTEAHMLNNNTLIIGSHVTSCIIGIAEEAAALGFRTLMDDISVMCHFHMFDKSFSILQAFTICPRSSYWAAFKTRNPLCILYSFFFIWILNLLISSNLIISISASRNGSLSRVIIKSLFLGECTT
ncbi:hypothetical protein HPG69_008841, partial [Diceros bicornis minor]